MSVKIQDKDKGFRKLVESMGELGTITIGVQGDEAKQKHPESDLTVGEIAAIHELGLGGTPRRSWLVEWMDANRDRMRNETADALRQVLQGRISRNKALAALGFAWTADVRERVSSGQVTPGLPSSNPRGAGAPPLFDTHTLHNAITYKIYVPQARSIKNRTQRSVINRKK